MAETDCLIEPRWLLPVATPGAVEGHAVRVRAGRIDAIGPVEALRAESPSLARVELPGHALMPGLVNAHTHAAMALFRGMADDLPLGTWLRDHIWPAEARSASPEFARDGTELAMAEFLRGGVTCFNDMYFFPDSVLHAVATAGMRATLGLVVIDFPNPWSSSADEAIDKGLELHDACADEPLVQVAFAPHAPYTVSAEPLRRIRVLADELDLPVHMHVHETAAEVDDFVAQHGVRPIAHLDALGLLNERLLAVHMTQLKDAEVELVARRGTHVLHCPESNLKLASGFCPVAQLAAAGVNIALGTDGAASNNDLDLLSEMRTASLLAKGVAGDATAFGATAALHAATLGGARALGLDEEIGSIEPGKSADLVAIDLDQLATTPVYDAVSQVVFAASAQQVSDVWVAGRRLLDAGELTTLDAERVRRTANSWRDRIASAAP